MPSFTIVVTTPSKTSPTPRMFLAVCGAHTQAHDVVHAQVDVSGSASPSDECMDTNESCRTWSADGECSANPAFMHSACRESCSMSRFKAPV